MPRSPQLIEAQKKYDEKCRPLTLRLRSDVVDAVRDHAKSQGISTGEYLRKLIAADLRIDFDTRSPSS